MNATTPYMMTSTKRTPKSRVLAILIPFVVTMAGIGLIATLVVAYQNYLAFERIAVVTEGSVVGFDIEHHTTRSEGRTRRYETYAPVVMYVTESGRQQTFTSDFHSDPPAFRRGDVVEVMYDPENPEIAEIRTLANPTWNILSMIPAGVGVLVTLFGIGLFQQMNPKAASSKTKQQNMPYPASSPISPA